METANSSTSRAHFTVIHYHCKSGNLHTKAFLSICHSETFQHAFCQVFLPNTTEKLDNCIKLAIADDLHRRYKGLDDLRQVDAK